MPTDKEFKWRKLIDHLIYNVFITYDERLVHCFKDERK